MKVRFHVLGLMLLACGTAALASAEERSCDSDARVIVSHYKYADGRLQTVVEMSGFCNPMEALVAGLVAGYEAERTKQPAADGTLTMRPQLSRTGSPNPR